MVSGKDYMAIEWESFPNDAAGIWTRYEYANGHLHKVR